jgi:hypothetical protein
MSHHITPPPIFTKTPIQHPSLILGALHLLCWIVFHPAAFQHYLVTLNPELKTDSSLIYFFQQRGWRKASNLKFLIQSLMILPILGTLFIASVNLLLGVSFLKVLVIAAFGLVFGIAFGLVLGIVFGLAAGLIAGVAFPVAVAIPIVVAFCITGMKVNMDIALVVTVVAGILLYHSLPFLLYLALQSWNSLLYYLEQSQVKGHRLWLRWHSVGWCEWESSPLTDLDQHLLLATKIDPQLGLEAINFVSTTKQQWAAQAAQIELDAEILAQCHTLTEIQTIPSNWGHSAFVDSALDIFQIFQRISEDVRAATKQQGSYNQRQSLAALSVRIDSDLHNFNLSPNQYTARLRPVLVQWQQIIIGYVETQRRTTEESQSVESPYIIGVPLTIKEQIFTGRQDFGIRLEQLIMDRRRPPLLLYGQRRMGKTSILRNLERLLPSTIIPLFVDLQGKAASAQSLAGFFYALADDIRDVAPDHLKLPPVELNDFSTEPTIQFNKWLDQLEAKLGDKVALLTLDEFEALDKSFERGLLNEEDILGLFRRLIQHRPKFKVLIAGSHTLAEYQRWSSYLINVQTIHVSYLQVSEAEQLITQPVPDFPLRYTRAALKLVLNLTRCHPLLVQLLCEEIIFLKNEQAPDSRRLATPEDVESAVPFALNSGSVGFFGDLQTTQIDNFQRKILTTLARSGEGASLSEAQLAYLCPDNIASSLQNLLQREILELVATNSYRFQVELIRRWFAREN